MTEKPLKFTDAPAWVNTVVRTNYWEEVFRQSNININIGNRIKYNYTDKHCNLFQWFEASAGNGFGFPDFKTESYIQMVSPCIRHDIESIDYLVRVPAWAPQGSSYGLVLFPENVQQELKEILKGTEFLGSLTIPANTKLRLQAMDLDYYFDCRFAGPLILACMVGMAGNDNTMQDTLALLDRIINHPTNLAWTPVDMNKSKATFFNTSTDKEMNPKNAATVEEFKLRVDYMQQMAPGFETLVRTALEACVWSYLENTLIVRVLKVLYQSPFCQGGWDKVMTRSSYLDMMG
ncbi:hypothetical protein CPB86DRAFT_789638 [Serendipita vermifera]|nr:hypothetical protein CPB86DRAFT_789638 [Serendipita vermifera]